MSFFQNPERAAKVAAARYFVARKAAEAAEAVLAKARAKVIQTYSEAGLYNYAGLLAGERQDRKFSVSDAEQVLNDAQFAAVTVTKVSAPKVDVAIAAGIISPELADKFTTNKPVAFVKVA